MRRCWPRKLEPQPARCLPNVSFVSLTGTPIEKTDGNTRAVFGAYVSICGIPRDVADKATVPIMRDR